MKKIFIIVSLIILSASVFAQMTKQPQRCAPEDFVICPCDNGEYTITDLDSYCKELYNMGFNMTWCLTPDQLKYAKKHNLKATLQTMGLNDNSIEDLNLRAKDWAEKSKKAIPKEQYNNIFWCITRDEPRLSDVENMVPYTKATKEILGLRPYINLNPNCAAEEYIGKDYEYYINTITKKCGLDYISYDNYSFFIKEGFVQDRYFSNIEKIAKCAKENNVPFYNTILSVAHFQYAPPTDFSIELQGWSTLAYGGKGLIYYTVIQPPIGNYRGAAYDGFGYKTPTFDMIRLMNLQIHSIMPVYKDLKHLNTFHYGYVPNGSNGPETSVLCNEFKADSDVLVGEFKGKDKKSYLIVVNKTDFNTFIHVPKFRNGKGSVLISEYCDPFKGRPNEKELPFGEENQWLAPGHGMIIRSE